MKRENIENKRKTHTHTHGDRERERKREIMFEYVKNERDNI